MVFATRVGTNHDSARPQPKPPASGYWRISCRPSLANNAFGARLKRLPPTLPKTRFASKFSSTTGGPCSGTSAENGQADKG